MQEPLEQNLLADSAFYSSLLESLPLNVYAKDVSGRFVYANVSYCQRIGLSLKKLVGMNDFDIHPKELAEKYRSDDNCIITSGKTENIEEQWQTHEGGGASGWVHVIKAPLYDHAQQNIVGTIGIFWDITRKKLGDIVVAEERNLLRTLIDNLPDYIYVKDQESKFLLGNEAVAQLMGVDDPGMLLGKADSDFYSVSQAKKFYTDEAEVITTGQPFINIEESVTSPAGDKRLLVTSKLPLKSVDGEIVGVIGIGHDVTEQRKKELETGRLEKQLQNAKRMETIGTLTAGIAHDFNNLLSVINGYTELMQLTTPQEDKNQENLRKVLSAGRSAAKLVGQLLTFSREQVAQARVIDINYEIENSRTRLKGMLGDICSVGFDLGEHIWPVRIDPAQLEQVVTNMVMNARDAMPDGGNLRIRTENFLVESSSVCKHPSLRPGEWVELVFQDSGIGMATDVQNHVFEPFFTTKPKQQGTGLGLATVFGIIKQNKGYVFVDSNLGVGSEFSVYLPKAEVVTAENADVAISSSVSDAVSTVKDEVILVVEDDPAVLSLARTILTNAGYTTYTADNGAEALLIIEQKRQEIAMIVTDVVMPGMSGKMLADEVVRRKLAMKVLFMSGHSSDVLGQYGVVSTTVHFIQKPFSGDELVSKVSSMLVGK